MYFPLPLYKHVLSGGVGCSFPQKPSRIHAGGRFYITKCGLSKSSTKIIFLTWEFCYQICLSMKRNELKCEEFPRLLYSVWIGRKFDKKKKKKKKKQKRGTGRGNQCKTMHWPYQVPNYGSPICIGIIRFMGMEWYCHE